MGESPECTARVFSQKQQTRFGSAPGVQKPPPMPHLAMAESSCGVVKQRANARSLAHLLERGGWPGFKGKVWGFGRSV